MADIDEQNGQPLESGDTTFSGSRLSDGSEDVPHQEGPVAGEGSDLLALDDKEFLRKFYAFKRDEYLTTLERLLEEAKKNGLSYIEHQLSNSNLLLRESSDGFSVPKGSQLGDNELEQIVQKCYDAGFDCIYCYTDGKFDEAMAKQIADFVRKSDKFRNVMAVSIDGNPVEPEAFKNASVLGPLEAESVEGTSEYLKQSGGLSVGFGAAAAGVVSSVASLGSDLMTGLAKRLQGRGSDNNPNPKV